MSRRFKFTLLTAVVLTQLLSVISSAKQIEAGNSVELRKKQIEVFSFLKKKGYFRLASCRELASNILNTNRLPEIGKHPTGASFNGGVRGSYDRSHEADELPELNDQLITSEGNDHLKTKVSMKKLPSATENLWQISLERLPSNGKSAATGLKTVFEFKSVSSGGITRCNLTSAHFETTDATVAKVPPLPSVYSANQNCANPFIYQVEDEQPAPSKIASWVQADCAWAIHYSLQAKEMSHEKLAVE